jgi:hypothetical protein
VSIHRLSAGPGFERLLLDTTPRQAAMTLYEAFGSVGTNRESTPASEMVCYENPLVE